MRALFDVNVLIALLDAAHQHHELAFDWLRSHGALGWASCPITQNGYVRIVSQPGYPNPTSTFDALRRLRLATQTEHHAFWPDSVSLLDVKRIDDSRIHGPHTLTDHYLLALAVANGGRLVTFDRGIAVGAVRGASKAHVVSL